MGQAISSDIGPLQSYFVLTMAGLTNKVCKVEGMLMTPCKKDTLTQSDYIYHHTHHFIHFFKQEVLVSQVTLTFKVDQKRW